MQRENIGYAYCKQNNDLYCNILGCSCSGYYYEIPLSDLENGHYDMILYFGNNSECLNKLYIQEIFLNGSLKDLQHNEIGNKTLYNTPNNLNNPQEFKRKVKVYNGIYYDYIDNCTVKFYSLYNTQLKSSDVIFHLTANTSNNTYLDNDIIELKEALYNDTSKQYETTFNICDTSIYPNNTMQLGAFIKIRDNDLNEYVELDNNGYIGNINRNNDSNGTIQNLYYYIDNNTFINYTNNISSSDNANDKYYYEGGTTDYLIYLVLIFVAIIIMYSIVILFKSKKHK
jgi:hypothetical protein